MCCCHLQSNLIILTSGWPCRGKIWALHPFPMSRLGVFLRTQAIPLGTHTTSHHGRAPSRLFLITWYTVMSAEPIQNIPLLCNCCQLVPGLSPQGFDEGEQDICAARSFGAPASPITRAGGGTGDALLHHSAADSPGKWETRHLTAPCLSFLSCKCVLKQ